MQNNVILPCVTMVFMGWESIPFNPVIVYPRERISSVVLIDT
jgi:hypothetical protein